MCFLFDFIVLEEQEEHGLGTPKSSSLIRFYKDGNRYSYSLFIVCVPAFRYYSSYGTLDSNLKKEVILCGVTVLYVIYNSREILVDLMLSIVIVLQYQWIIKTNVHWRKHL